MNYLLPDSLLVVLLLELVSLLLEFELLVFEFELLELELDSVLVAALDSLLLDDLSADLV